MGLGVTTTTGGVLIGHGLSMTTYHAQDFKMPDVCWENIIFSNNPIHVEKRSSAPPPDSQAQGYPHTIIERPGPNGQYTTHNGDGTFSQYRGSGKSHGNIPRPNVKENKLDNSPKGPIPGKPIVRPAQPEEIPKGKV